MEGQEETGANPSSPKPNRFAPLDRPLSEQEFNESYQWMVRDGMASQTMSSLQSGAFMVAFILLMGGSNFYVGLMASIPFLTQFFQLPAVWLVEKIRRRKLIVFTSVITGRSLWILIAVLPLFLPKSYALKGVVLVFFLSSSLSAISNCSWNSWVRDFIPKEKRGQLMSKRMQYMQGAGMAISLAAGFSLAYWKRMLPEFELHGYLLVFLVGAASGLTGTYFISRMLEPKMPIRAETFSLREALAKPLRDKNFSRLLIFKISWNFAVNLATPFFTVYMLKRLNYSISWVVAMSVISALSNMFVLRIWGKLSDRFSAKSVLAVCGPLFILCILMWPFTSLHGPHKFTPVLLVLIHIFSGIANAGVTLAAGNITIKLAPAGEATGYLVMNNMVASLSSGIANLIGGTLAAFFAYQELYLNLGYLDHIRDSAIEIPLLSFRELDFLFLIAGILGFYASHRLTMVKEEGEVEEDVFMDELMAEFMRGARHLTTAAGPVKPSSFPFGIFSRFKD